MVLRGQLRGVFGRGEVLAILGEITQRLSYMAETFKAKG
jgi:hypothetical protein